MKTLTLFILLILFTTACSDKYEPVADPVKSSPGKPRHYDVGDQIIKKNLPEDVADGFLAFNQAPGFSYGVFIAHKDISQRSHDRSDMLLYIHSGSARFHVGDQSFHIGPGDVVYVPRGAIYSATQTINNRQLQFFTVYSPPLDPNDIIYHDNKQDTDTDSDD